MSGFRANLLRTLLLVVVVGAAARAFAADVYGSRSSPTVYHTRDCSSGRRIAADNRVVFKSEQEAIAAGRRKCKLCDKLEGGRAVSARPVPASRPASQPADDADPRPREAAGEQAAPPANAAPAVRARIAQVISGDTLATSTGTLIQVRCVHCPEPDQPGGAAARRLTTRLVSDVEVRLIEESAVPPAGGTPARRLRCHVIGRDGADVAEALISAGLGWFDRECKSSRSESLIKMEEAARRQQVGVWKPLAGPAGQQKVVATQEGRLYHAETCVHLKKSAGVRTLTVNEAKAAGYAPCSMWTLSRSEDKRRTAGKLKNPRPPAAASQRSEP